MINWLRRKCRRWVLDETQYSCGCYFWTDPQNDRVEGVSCSVLHHDFLVSDEGKMAIVRGDLRRALADLEGEV